MKVVIFVLGIIEFMFFFLDNISIKYIVLFCGVYGNEMVLIEMCDDWVKLIFIGWFEVIYCVLFLFGNLFVMDIVKWFVEENMNCLFSGVYLEGEGCNNIERQCVIVLEEVINQFFVYV